MTQNRRCNFKVMPVCADIFLNSLIKMQVLLLKAIATMAAVLPAHPTRRSISAGMGWRAAPIARPAFLAQLRNSVLNVIVRCFLDNPTRDRPPECPIESLGGFRCAAAAWRISFNNKAIARLKGHNFNCRVWLLCLLTLEFRRFPSCQHSQYLGLNLVYWNIRCLLNLAVVHRFDFHWSAIPTECIIACAQLHHVLRDCQGQSEVILAFHQRTGRLVSGVE